MQMFMALARDTDLEDLLFKLWNVACDSAAAKVEPVSGEACFHLPPKLGLVDMALLSADKSRVLVYTGT